MPVALVTGDVQLGSDGVLQGWCWNPKKPAERLVLEVLIDGKVVSTFIASRFREDLRDHNIGDGYYGFVATLPKSLLDAGNHYVISARERTSGCCFWQQVRGEPGLPVNFADRLAQAQRRYSQIARSSRFQRLGTSSLSAKFVTEMGALGTHLLNAANGADKNSSPVKNARSALRGRALHTVIKDVPNPQVSIIVIADSPASGVLAAITAVVPRLAALQASLLLLDRGANVDVALAPSLFGDLRYVFAPGGELGSFISSGLRYSSGNLLIFIRNPNEPMERGLAKLVALLSDKQALFVNARSAEAAFDICAASAEDIPRWFADVPLGLELAGPRALFERLQDSLRPGDDICGLEAIDLVIRSIRENLEICMWDEPLIEPKSELRAEATH